MTFRSSCRLGASALLICLACVAQAQVESASASPTTSMSGGSTLSQQQLAAEQVRQQEKQRIAGVVPNFNVSYNENAVPLSPRQKLHIALRTAVDGRGIDVVDAEVERALDDGNGDIEVVGFLKRGLAAEREDAYLVAGNAEIAGGHG